jgi:hypothetical protein
MDLPVERDANVRVEQAWPKARSIMESMGLLQQLPPDLLVGVLGELCSDDLLRATAACRALHRSLEAATNECIARGEAQVTPSWLTEFRLRQQRASTSTDTPLAPPGALTLKLRRLRTSEVALEAFVVMQAKLRKHSAEHVRNLLRLHLTTVAWLRSFFAQDCYEQRSLMWQQEGETERGVMVKVLKDGDGSAAGLVRWLEDGVFTALHDEYLERYQVVVCEDVASTRVIEQWTARIEWKTAHGVLYPAFAGVPDPFEQSFTGCATLDQALKSAQGVVIELRARSQSMPKVPRLFHISLRLYYVKGTPYEYEPSEDFRPHVY